MPRPIGVEILQVRKGKDAISEYVGKYLEGGLALPRHSLKGCRRVEFDRRRKNEWQCCSRVFSWNSPGAKTWRKHVGERGATVGAADIPALRRKLGPKWAYRMREIITWGPEDDWLLILASIRAGHRFAA